MSILARLVHMLQALVLLIIVILALLFLFWAIREALGRAGPDRSIHVPCFGAVLPETRHAGLFLSNQGRSR